MSVVRFEGFDHLDDFYYARRVKWRITGGCTPGMAAGRYSADGHYLDRSFTYNNTGSHKFNMEHNFGFGSGKTGVKFGFHLHPFNSSGAMDADTDFFQLRYQDTGASIIKELAFAIRSDGRLQIWRSGYRQRLEETDALIIPGSIDASNFDGILLAELPAGTIQDRTDQQFEFRVTKTRVTIRKNQVEIYDQALTTVTDSGHNFTRVGFCYASGSITDLRPDNFYLCDDPDDPWLGEVRVSTQFITPDRSIGDVSISNLTRFLTNPGLTSFYSTKPEFGGMLMEYHNLFPGNNVVDEDITYLEVAAGATATGIFHFDNFYPVGNVVAVSPTITLKNTSTLTGVYESILRLNGVNSFEPAVDIEPLDTTVWGQQWRSYQSITQGSFNEQDFADGLWEFGFRVTAPTDTPLHITQFVIERLHQVGTSAAYRNRYRQII